MRLPLARRKPGQAFDPDETTRAALSVIESLRATQRDIRAGRPVPTMSQEMRESIEAMDLDNVDMSIIPQESGVVMLELR